MLVVATTPHPFLTGCVPPSPCLFIPTACSLFFFTSLLLPLILLLPLLRLRLRLRRRLLLLLFHFLLPLHSLVVGCSHGLRVPRATSAQRPTCRGQLNYILSQLRRAYLNLNREPRARIRLQQRGEEGCFNDAPRTDQRPPPPPSPHRLSDGGYDGGCDGAWWWLTAAFSSTSVGAAKRGKTCQPGKRETQGDDKFPGFLQREGGRKPEPFSCKRHPRTAETKQMLETISGGTAVFYE